MFVVATLFAQSDAAVSIPYGEAVRIIQSVPADELPAELKNKSPAELREAWPRWVARHDTQIRERLIRGDDDSIVNLLLFGVSFTTQPRMTEGEVFLGVAPRQAVVDRRIADLIRGAAADDAGERLLFVRQRLREAGIVDPATPAGQRRARLFVASLLERYIDDVRGFVQATARREGLATLFRDRGLSSDTSIYPGFAIEEALEALSSAGAIGRVRRVAIVGPGLDFADKREGLDFYPQQTIQPFAVLDSLLRLRLATAGEVELTTFDLSPRVNHHLESAIQRARAGGRYTIELPRNPDIRWHSELLSYWRRFGDQIGDPALATPPPSLAGHVESRAVRIRPDATLSIVPREMNIVLQRLEHSSPDHGFDLVIATNTLIYYDVFEQALALTNIAAMLRPGGWFLANDASVGITSLDVIGRTELSYSDQLNSRERLTWYRRR